MHRKTVSVASALFVVALGAGACGEQQPQASTPPCAGEATAEYGLGNAIHAAAGGLASLSPRFSTGSATVVPAPGTGRLVVEVHLCSLGAGLDATKDAATVIAHQIADAASLGSRVARVVVVNPPTGGRIVADPFDAAAFAAVGAPASMRSTWR
ncbi:hypothetical protein [Gordonia sp. (in: high G+C Gram-positive bacteria)]|uniref:hypothetical protein n=1 Tax=Gordonia sp. (in: high G+C Gram-positive bacteria) TaxID=84139 RepID=UPI0039E2D1C7